MRPSRILLNVLVVITLALPLAACVSTSSEPRLKTSIWNEVKFGMTREQVHKVLGPPTEKGLPADQEAWRQGPGVSAWFFYVRYGENKKVLDYRSVYGYRSEP